LTRCVRAANPNRLDPVVSAASINTRISSASSGKRRQCGEVEVDRAPRTLVKEAQSVAAFEDERAANWRGREAIENRELHEPDARFV